MGSKKKRKSTVSVDYLMFAELSEASYGRVADLLRRHRQRLLASNGEEDLEAHYQNCRATAAILLAHAAITDYVASPYRRKQHQSFELGRLTTKRRQSSPQKRVRRVIDLDGLDPQVLSEVKAGMRARRFDRLLSLLWLGYVRYPPIPYQVRKSFQPASDRVRGLLRELYTARRTKTDPWALIHKRTTRISELHEREVRLFKVKDIDRAADILLMQWRSQNKELIAAVLGIPIERFSVDVKSKPTKFL